MKDHLNPPKPNPTNNSSASIHTESAGNPSLSRATEVTAANDGVPPNFNHRFGNNVDPQLSQTRVNDGTGIGAGSSNASRPTGRDTGGFSSETGEIRNDKVQATNSPTNTIERDNKANFGTGDGSGDVTGTEAVDSGDGGEYSRNPRSKLTVQDIRLILYLIVTIKPFKYIGDRTISQMKKWDMIQKQFSLLKQNSASNGFIPTTRTLQRQLATAIKKAKNRVGDVDLERLAEPVFSGINERSSLELLEVAALELFELSETLKNGRLANGVLVERSLESIAMVDDLGRFFVDGQVSSQIEGTETPINSVVSEPIISTSVTDDKQLTKQGKKEHQTRVNDVHESPILQEVSETGVMAQDEIIKLISQLFSPTELTQLSHTRNQIKTLIQIPTDHKVPSNHSQVSQLIKDLWFQNNHLRNQTQQKINKIIDTNSTLVQQNKNFEAEQRDINRRLVEEVVGFLGDTPGLDEVKELLKEME